MATAPALHTQGTAVVHITASGSIAPTVPTASVGDTLLLWVLIADTAAGKLGTVTTPIAGWTLIGSVSDPSGSGPFGTLYAFVRIATGSDTPSISFSGTPLYSAAWINSYSGSTGVIGTTVDHSGSAAIAFNGGAGNTGSPLTTPALTDTSPTCLLVTVAGSYAFQAANPQTITAPSGPTTRQLHSADQIVFGCADLVLATTASPSEDWALPTDATSGNGGVGWSITLAPTPAPSRTLAAPTAALSRAGAARTISNPTAALSLAHLVRTIGSPTASLSATTAHPYNRAGTGYNALGPFGAPGGSPRTITAPTASLSRPGVVRTISSPTAALINTFPRTLAAPSAALSLTGLTRTLSAPTASLGQTFARTVSAPRACLMTPPTWRSGATATTAAGTATSLSVTPATGTAAGDTMVVTLIAYNAASNAAINFTTPAGGWAVVPNSLQTIDVGGTQRISAQRFVKRAGASEGATSFAVDQTCHLQATTESITNCDPSTPVNAAASSAIVANGNETLPQITPTVPNTLLLGTMFGGSNPTVISAPAGWSLGVQTTNGGIGFSGDVVRQWDGGQTPASVITNDGGGGFGGATITYVAVLALQSGSLSRTVSSPTAALTSLGLVRTLSLPSAALSQLGRTRTVAAPTAALSSTLPRTSTAPTAALSSAALLRTVVNPTASIINTLPRTLTSPSAALGSFGQARTLSAVRASLSLAGIQGRTVANPVGLLMASYARTVASPTAAIGSLGLTRTLSAPTASLSLAAVARTVSSPTASLTGGTVRNLAVTASLSLASITRTVAAPSASLSQSATQGRTLAAPTAALSRLGLSRTVTSPTASLNRNRIVANPTASLSAPIRRTITAPVAVLSGVTGESMGADLSLWGTGLQVQCVAIKCRPQRGGRLTNIRVGLQALGTNPNAVAAVYAADGPGGKPGTLLAYTPGQGTWGSRGVVDIPINLPSTKQGRYLWLAVNLQQGTAPNQIGYRSPGSFVTCTIAGMSWSSGSQPPLWPASLTPASVTVNAVKQDYLIAATMVLDQLRTYAVEVDWGSLGTPPLDEFRDVTSRTRIQEGVTFSRGRDNLRSYSPPMAGQCNFTLDNQDQLLSAELTSARLYGKGQPGRDVTVKQRLSGQPTLMNSRIPMNSPRGMNGLRYSRLWRGVTDDLLQQPERTARSVGMQCLGVLSQLAGKTRTTQLYENLTTGAAMNLILDAAGWPSGRRRIDTGQQVLRYWWMDDSDCMQEMVKLLNTEGPPAAIYESSNGDIVFEDRYYRTTHPRCLVSQATFADKGSEPSHSPGFIYTPKFRDVVNSVSMAVNQRTVDANPSVIWSIPGPVTVLGAKTQQFIITATDPFKNAVVPVSGVDYQVQGSPVVATLDQTSGARCTLTFSAPFGDATLTTLQLRAYSVKVSAALSQTQTSPAQALAYGRTWKLDTWPEISQDDARALCDAIFAGYKNPRVQMSIVMFAQRSDPNWLAAGLREISDRVTVVESWTGVDLECSLEKIDRSIMNGGPGDVVTFGLEKISPASGAGGTGRWDSSDPALGWDGATWAY